MMRRHGTGPTARLALAWNNLSRAPPRACMSGLGRVGATAQRMDNEAIALTRDGGVGIASDEPTDRAIPHPICKATANGGSQAEKGLPTDLMAPGSMLRGRGADAGRRQALDGCSAGMER